MRPIPTKIDVPESKQARAELLHMDAVAAMGRGWRDELTARRKVLRLNPMHYPTWEALASGALAVGDLTLHRLSREACLNILNSGGPPEDGLVYLGLKVGPDERSGQT